MAQRTNKNTRTKETKKDYKNQNFKMNGKLVKLGYFGKDEQHAWFVVEEETNGTKYMIKMFNLTDEDYDVLADSKEVEVSFNLSYNKNGNDISLQIVAYDIKSVE